MAAPLDSSEQLRPQETPYGAELRRIIRRPKSGRLLSFVTGWGALAGGIMRARNVPCLVNGALLPNAALSLFTVGGIAINITQIYNSILEYKETHNVKRLAIEAGIGAVGLTGTIVALAANVLCKC